MRTRRRTSTHLMNGVLAPGGIENAKAWVRQIRQTIEDRLTSMPLGCPLAPENEELDIPVRQLIVGRYRILFIVEKGTVTILHLRGPYVPQLYSSEEAED